MGVVILGLILRLMNILLQLFETYLTIRYVFIDIKYLQDIIIIECGQHFQNSKIFSNTHTQLGFMRFYLQFRYTNGKFYKILKFNSFENQLTQTLNSHFHMQSRFLYPPSMFCFTENEFSFLFLYHRMTRVPKWKISIYTYLNV